MTALSLEIRRAVESGQLLPSAAKNIEQMLARSTAPVVEQSIGELVANGKWDELNDRFFKTIAFGTGGLRGRTIGKIVTRRSLSGHVCQGDVRVPSLCDRA